MAKICHRPCGSGARLNTLRNYRNLWDANVLIWQALPQLSQASMYPILGVGTNSPAPYQRGFRTRSAPTSLVIPEKNRSTALLPVTSTCAFSTVFATSPRHGNDNHNNIANKHTIASLPPISPLPRLYLFFFLLGLHLQTATFPSALTSNRLRSRRKSFSSTTFSRHQNTASIQTQ